MPSARPNGSPIGAFVVWSLLLLGAAAEADVFDDAVLRVDFSGDTADDVTTPASPATAADLAFIDISSLEMPNSNGRAAAFNGRSSGIGYQLGIHGELKFTAPITCHARVRFETLDGRQFLGGRYRADDRFTWLIQTDGASAWGCFAAAKKTGLQRIGHPTEDGLKTGVFYDVFFLFRPPAKRGAVGSARTVVYNAETGQRVVRSRDWQTSIGDMFDVQNATFRLGSPRNGSSLVPLKGAIDQVNLWNRALPEGEMGLLSDRAMHPTGVFREPPSAEEKAKSVFYEDFETRDSANRVTFWTGYGNPVKVSYKGLTEEHAFSGRTSFKLDATFEKRGRYIWEIRLGSPRPPAAGKSFSGSVLLGEGTTAGIGLGVSFCFPPTAAGGFTGRLKRVKTTGGRWMRITDLGASETEDFDRYSQSMADLMGHSYVGYVPPTEVVPSIGRIMLDVYAPAGGRLLVYLDDIQLKQIPGRPQRSVPSDEPMHKRCLARIAQLTHALTAAVERADKIAWAPKDRWLKEAWDAKVSQVRASLAKLEKTIPFTVSAVARVRDNVARLHMTSLDVEALRSLGDASHVIYALDRLTNANDWILPADVLIPGRVSRQLSLSACRGEYEPASFVLKAMRTIEQLRLESGDLVGPEGGVIPADRVDIRLVQCWYQGASAGVLPDQSKSPKKLIPELLVNDPTLVRVDTTKQENYLKLTFPDRTEHRWISSLQPTGESILIKDCPVKDAPRRRPVTIPAGTNRQFWITFHVPDDIPAGDYTGAIRLWAKDQTLPPLTVTVRVHPFALAAPYYTSSIDYHGTPSAKASIASFPKSKQQMLAELKNMVAHGLTNCQHYFSVTDESLATVLQLRREAGMDNRVLYLKGHEMYLFHSQPAQLEKMKARVRHLKQIARPYGVEEIYFYGRDELAGQDLLRQRKAWQAVREAGGRIFVAGGRDNLPFVSDIQDVLVKAGWPDREFVQQWHKTGHKIFCYSNPQAGVENPETYRRNFGLAMWKFGYDGIANNAYQHSYGFVWNDFDHGRYRSHSMVYPTADGVVDTIAWEGFREGIDDVRYITTLEMFVRRLQSRNDTPTRNAVARARAFIGKLRDTYTVESSDLDTLRKGIVRHIVALHELRP